MAYGAEKVIDFYYGEYKNGLFGKKHDLKLFIYPSYIEGNGFEVYNGVLSPETRSFNISYSNVKNISCDKYDRKTVLLINYSYSTVVGTTTRTILFFGMEDVNKWVVTIKSAKCNFMEIQAKRKQQESERLENQKQLEINREQKAVDFFNSCYSFHIKDTTPVYKLYEDKNKIALIYIDNDKAINFLKIDGYTQEESNGVIAYDKIHYYEKVGDVHYTSQIHGTYSSYGGGFTGGNFSKLITAGGGLLFGLMGMTAGALLSYKPAKQEAINTNFQIDSDISKIDDRNIILNFYSDLKKQFIDIALPYDIYNFLQTYLPEKKYSIVEEVEKKTVVNQFVGLIENNQHEIKTIEQVSNGTDVQVSDFKQRIEKLIIMRDSGILSQDEFEEQKKKILELL